MPVLEVHNIEKHFGSTKVLEDISFSLEQGQALAIIGSSGSGKTTLLRCLNFLETPNQGRILVQGETLFDADDPATQRESEVRKKRLHFGMVFQSFNLFPQYTARKNVCLARELLAQEQPEAFKSAAARLWHREKLKRQYRKQAREAAKQGARAAEKTAVSAEKLAEKAAGFVKRHPGGVVIALACVLLLFTVQSCASSLVTLGNGIVGGIGASTYPAQDGDMLGAEAAYCALEAELQHYLDTYTSTHDYDEYHFDLDDIEHDPYVLISMLSALHEGEWTLEEVRGTLQTIFDRQYILTENVVTERRYYIETDTWTDSEGNTHTSSYRVYYDYYICTVTLKNEDLSHLPIYIMSGEQLSRYALYMAALGNRPDLFPNSGYVDKYITNPPQPYDVPEQYLSDPDFAALLTEAEKYLGYPYVWGGSSPATSFDCSGFLSYVLNQCGWDVGRLGAQGLYNYCTPVSSPRPGDLVFFRYTYDAPNPDGVTHCGLYVGDGMMLHCGDPVQFTSLNTSYWQSHFYAWGRLP